jgi:2-aminoadipate transaminase
VKALTFSADAGALAPSAIRRFASIINDPGVISFAGGVPNPETFPSEALAHAARRAIREHTAVSLQYGPTAGLPELRERAAGLCRARGIAADAGAVMLTTGSQQALDLLARVLLDPGDVVAVENPAYVGALAAFRARRPEFLGVERDAGRLDVASLEAQVAARRSTGRRVAFLYTIPNFQNPSGWTLSGEGRRELLEAASRLDLLVVEDDPYAEIYFGEPPPPALAATDREGRVVHLASFSKTLAAGLRCGYLAGPAELLARMELAKQAADLCSSMLDQFILSIYFAENDYAAHLKTVRAFYARQKQTFLGALRRESPESVVYSDPGGGLFTWGRLPEGLDAEKVLEKSLTEEKVAYVPGEAFFVGEVPGARRHFRLTFAKETPERLEEGARRLGRLFRREAA